MALVVPSVTLADGMVMPPIDQWIQETDQKAVIFYDKGVETMVISIAFQGDAEDFAWIVPTPSKPTVKKGSDELFTNLESLTGYSDIYYNDSLAPFGAIQESTKSEVTVVETKKIDYYDVTVLSSTDNDSLTKWLNDNGYNFPTAASYILNDYINNGWYFVAMKIDPESLGWTDVEGQLRSGHATPVSLSFTTENIVYPMKISSVTSQGGTTEVGVKRALDVPAYTTGRSSTAVEIDTDDLLTFPAADVINASSGTIEFWVQPDSSWESTTSGYNEFVNIVNASGINVFEFRRGNDSVRDNLQFIAYSSNSIAKSWKTADTSPFTWISGEWYNIAVTWSALDSPVVYVNNIAYEMEPVNNETTWSIMPVTGGSMYIGQQNITSSSGLSALHGALDDLRISSTQKTASEIEVTYRNGLNFLPVEQEADTLFLAHFDNSLFEVVSSDFIDYQQNSVKPTVIPVDYDSYLYDSVAIQLYVIGANRMTLPSFSTQFANWIDKESIEDLAIDTQGDPLLTPTKKKYFLTKLYRSMTYEQMTEDLFLREYGSNTTKGNEIKAGKQKSQTPFLIVVSIAVAISILLAVIILILSRREPKKDIE